MDEHVCQFFGHAFADQYVYRHYSERVWGSWRSDRGRRGAVSVATTGLGVANGGGSSAFRRAALDPRKRRRISGPTVPDRQSETPIHSERSAPKATQRCGGESVASVAEPERVTPWSSPRPHVRLSTGRAVSQYAGNEGCAGLAGAEPHA